MEQIVLFPTSFSVRASFSTHFQHEKQKRIGINGAVAANRIANEKPRDKWKISFLKLNRREFSFKREGERNRVLYVYAILPVPCKYLPRE